MCYDKKDIILQQNTFPIWHNDDLSRYSRFVQKCKMAIFHVFTYTFILSCTYRGITLHYVKEVQLEDVSPRGIVRKSFGLFIQTDVLYMNRIQICCLSVILSRIHHTIINGIKSKIKVNR